MNKIFNGYHILIVEDEYLIAMDMSCFLEELGAVIVGPESSVFDAMNHINNNTRIDAAILDVNLRKEFVYPVADALRSRGIPFIFATGYDAKSIKCEYLDIPRCQKPVSSEKIIQILKLQISISQNRKDF